jgi:hypothetical protein
MVQKYLLQSAVLYTSTINVPYPRFHKWPPLFLQVGTLIGRFDLVRDNMSEQCVPEYSAASTCEKNQLTAWWLQNRVRGSDQLGELNGRVWPIGQGMDRPAGRRNRCR